MNIKAIIFDLNGTILTDEDEYGRAFNKVLESLGVTSQNEIPHITGVGLKENWKEFIKKFDIKTEKTVDELVKETQLVYTQSLNKVTLKKGFLDFVTRMRNEGIKIGLATSNDRMILERVFINFDIQKYFDAIVTSDDVKINKPNPEIFSLCANKLNVDYDECVVFEDSQAGVDAANKIGMFVIGVARDTLHARSLKGVRYSIYDFVNFKL